MRIELSGILTVHDYAKLMRYHAVRTTWLFFVPICLISLLNVYFVISSGQSDVGTGIAPLAILAALWSAGVYLVPYFSAKLQMGPRAERGEGTRLIFDASGIQVDGHALTSQLGWQRLESVEETESAFYLYVSKVSALVLPKRLFEDAEQLAAWCELVKKFLTKEKWHRRWLGRWF